MKSCTPARAHTQTKSVCSVHTLSICTSVLTSLPGDGEMEYIANLYLYTIHLPQVESRSSSAPSGQSASPSHFQFGGIQAPLVHRKAPSGHCWPSGNVQRIQNSGKLVTTVICHLSIQTSICTVLSLLSAQCAYASHYRWALIEKLKNSAKDRYLLWNHAIAIKSIPPYCFS